MQLLTSLSLKHVEHVECQLGNMTLSFSNPKVEYMHKRKYIFSIKDKKDQLFFIDLVK